MTIKKLRNFGKYGVIADIPAYDLPDEAWTDARNVRFVANRFEKMSGYGPLLNPVAIASEPAQVFINAPISDSSNNSAILFATKSGIYEISGEGPRDITPKDVSGNPIPFAATDEKPWGVTQISNILVFNSSVTGPYAFWSEKDPNSVVSLEDSGWGQQWSPPDPKDPNAPPQKPKETWFCEVMKSYKNYLIALSMTEGTGIYPQRVRWSGLAQQNNLPEDWFVDDPTKDGGFVDLADCVGSIVDGRQMRDYFLIYTDRETYIMKYTGGEFVFDIQKLFPDSGLLNKNCVVEYEGGNHFVISENDIFVHDGSTRTSVATDLIKNKLLDEIINVNYRATKVFSYPARKEIWVCYVSKSNTNATGDNYALDTAAVWNWQNGTWTFADLPDIYHLDMVKSPEEDRRSWVNPMSKDIIAPITSYKMDVPFTSIPIGGTFRVDLVYKPQEFIQPGTRPKIEWTLEDSSGGVSTIGTFTKDAIDNSAIFTATSAGKANIVATYWYYQDPNDPNNSPIIATPVTDKMEIEVTSSGTIVLRHQASDIDPTTGLSYPETVYRPDPYDEPENHWDSTEHDSEQWEKKGFSFSARVWMASSKDKYFYQMDVGTLQTVSDGGGTGGLISKPVPASISKYAISVADGEPDLSYHKTFRQIYPLISGVGSVTFVVGGSNDPFTPPTSNELHEYVIGQDYKVDCFTNYRYLSLDIIDTNEGDWQMSGLDLDYFLGGRF